MCFFLSVNTFPYKIECSRIFNHVEPLFDHKFYLPGTVFEFFFRVIDSFLKI